MVTCYNEAAAIPQLHRELEPVLAAISDRYDVELIFVDDGSTDGTADRIREHWPSLGARVISHERNGGLGAGLRTGTMASRGELVLWTDADCTFPPHTIPELLALLTPGVDVVTGSHYHPQGGVRGVPANRLAVSRLGSWLYGWVTGGYVHTYTSMYRVYRREILMAVPRWSDGHVALSETLIFPMRAGHRVAEYPTLLFVRRFGFSKMRLVRTSLTHLKLVAELLAWRLFGREIPRTRWADSA